MNKLTHVTEKGKVNMVSIKNKNKSLRNAEAYGEVLVSRSLFGLLLKNSLAKGDVLTTAKIAGIQAGKKTCELIPLCHNILISKIDIKIRLESKGSKVVIRSVAESLGETGVEMEALTAVSIAALTIYDMCKAVEKDIKITNIKLLKKTGGKSGNFENKELENEK